MFLIISRNIFCRIISVCFFSCILILSGCATLTLEPYTGQQVDKYKDHKVKGGLALAIDPMLDVAECKKYFGVDLLSKKILPIFIVVENKSDSSSFTILKKSIKLIDKETFLGQADKDAGKENAEGGAVVGLTGAVLIAPPLILAGMKMLSDATVIKHSISSQEFQTRTLSPGEKASGFLYFQIPGNKNNVDLVLRMEAVNPISKDIVVFDNFINLKFNDKSI